ncbi:11426_t:CDS:2, partial [Cetraspora pellucida]
NKEIVPIKNIPDKKFKEVVLNYSSSENNNKFEQENNLFSIKDTELFDNIELENSDEEKISLSSKNTENEQLAKRTLAIYNYTILKIIKFQYSITNISFYATESKEYSAKLIKPFSKAYLTNKNLNLLNYYTKIYSNNNLNFYAKEQLADNFKSYLVSKRIIKAVALKLCSEYFKFDLTYSDLGAYFLAQLKDKNRQAIY